MENQRIGMSITLILLPIYVTLAAAQSDCDTMIISMSPCLNYLTKNSTSPMPGCCTQLGSIVKSRPECLCQVLDGGGSSLGLGVDQTLAQSLPATCKVETPALSSCRDEAPNSTPAGRTNSLNKEPSGNGSSDGSHNIPLLLLILVASYASTITM